MGSEHLLSQAASFGDSWQVAFDFDTHSQSNLFQWVWWRGGCSFSRNRRFHSSFFSRQTHWFDLLQGFSCSEYLPYFLFRSYCVSRQSLQSSRLRSGNPNMVLASLCSEYSLDALSSMQFAACMESPWHSTVCWACIRPIWSRSSRFDRSLSGWTWIDSGSKLICRRCWKWSRRNGRRWSSCTIVFSCLLCIPWWNFCANRYRLTRKWRNEGK